MRSIPFPRRRFPGLALVLPLLLFAWSACEPANDPAPAPVASSGGNVEKDMLDLVAASTPLPATAPAVDQADWYVRRKETLERLRFASHEHGLAALRFYEEKSKAEPALLADLLDVAAHAATAETTPVLSKLAIEYGPDLLIRRRAVELLGEVAPEEAVGVLEPILRGELRNRTLPPEDTLLDAWHAAVTKIGRDPTEILCLIATDLRREPSARYLATRFLGDTPSAQGSAALEQLVIESNGDHLIRRFAAQSLEKTLPKDDFCARMRAVLEKEADVNFQLFLQDVLERSCR